MLATTCSLSAVAAVTFKISLACTTRGAVSNSIVVLAATAFTLKRLNTVLPVVNVSVIVSALALSLDTKIDFTIPVVSAAHVYSVVTLVAVRSTFAFTYVFAIILKTILLLRLVLHPLIY